MHSFYDLTYDFAKESDLSSSLMAKGKEPVEFNVVAKSHQDAEKIATRKLSGPLHDLLLVIPRYPLHVKRDEATLEFMVTLHQT